ncbi:unnamed protein product [Rhodiola kirilowii]
MANFLTKRGLAFNSQLILSLRRSLSLSTIPDIHGNNATVHAADEMTTKPAAGQYCDGRVGNVIPLLFTKSVGTHRDKCDIEIVDHDAWKVSSGLAQAWRGLSVSVINDTVVSKDETEADVDDVEDMRIRGRLFYKLEKDSKEFEEYHYEFRGKGSKKNKKKKDSVKQQQHPKEENAKFPAVGKQSEIAKFPRKLLETSNFCTGKRIRTPTFNQLTGPYHEPFCLDIFISKGSVRACIIHRATSKVVAVAHSISKDIKFELGSTRDAKACATVGRLLAQRAVEDDIHNVIYTPRKGEKLEGKLLLVLQTVMDNGVNVKLKIKQRKPKKTGHKLPH